MLPWPGRSSGTVREGGEQTVKLHAAKKPSPRLSRAQAVEIPRVHPRQSLTPRTAPYCPHLKALGRAHGQRPLRPWGAVERRALVDGEGLPSGDHRKRHPSGGGRPWSTKTMWDDGVGEGGRQTETFAVRDMASRPCPSVGGLNRFSVKSANDRSPPDNDCAGRLSASKR